MIKTEKYLKSTRLSSGKIADGTWLGPWAPYETDQENVNNMMTDEQKERERIRRKQRASKLPNWAKDDKPPPGGEKRLKSDA